LAAPQSLNRAFLALLWQFAILSNVPVDILVENSIYAFKRSICHPRRSFSDMIIFD